MKSPYPPILAAAFALAAILAQHAVAQVNTPPGYDDVAKKSAASLNAERLRAKGLQSFYPANQFDLSGLPRYVPQQQVSGKLTIIGNNYIGNGRIAEWWKDEFIRFHPGISIEYDLPTAAIAHAALIYSDADVVMGHLPLFYDMLGFQRKFGYDPLDVMVLTGSLNVSGWGNAMVIQVNKANPVSKITLQQLDGVFGSKRAGGWVGTTWHPEPPYSRGADKNIRTWGQLGLTGEWADKTINPYGFSLRYNTSGFFADAFLYSSDKWNENLLAFGNYVRADGTIYGEQDQINDILMKDRYGISCNLYRDDSDNKVKTLAVARDDKSPYYLPTLDTRHNLTYPIQNHYWWYVNIKPGDKLQPKVKEFIRYTLSREGQDVIQRDGKYVPLPAEKVREELAKLDSR
ncbi:MAG: hypothetical protein PHQ04_08150 [Opitutaceae bacterium]|nr:hypothetical protein [Opitutaceae bacterium]